MAAIDATGRADDGILVIDDDPATARVIARTLEAAGFAVTTADSGRRGLSLAAQGSFGLVILDLVLPDVDGLAVLDRFRRLHPRQRVLVLSALDDADSKVRCLEDGACDYVTKPFEPAELAARVRVRLGDLDDEPERYVEFGGFRLDRRKRRVGGPDGTSPLSTREFVLLEYLMRRGGTACTRDELLAEVWGYTFETVTNVLDVYVGRLRGKLGADTIQTVRNVGYEFVGE